MNLKEFFTAILPEEKGWVPFCYPDPSGQRLTEAYWFEWPLELDKMVAWVATRDDQELYWSPMLFDEPPSKTNPQHVRKSNVIKVRSVYCDGDESPVEHMNIPPTVTVQTSPGHWQGYWVINDYKNLEPYQFENMCRGLYAVHEHEGMDSGWALAKRLRVPETMNRKAKYGNPRPVKIINTSDTYTVKEFTDNYQPYITNANAPEDIPVFEPGTDRAIVSKLNNELITRLWSETPTEDWSKAMYHLECLMWEAGCDNYEVFAVLSTASCNKFARENRPESDLWKQIYRDRETWEENQSSEEYLLEPDVPEIVTQLRPTSEGYWGSLDFLDPDEVYNKKSFVDIYDYWVHMGSKQSPRAFNKAAAAVLLSSVLARYAKLELTSGTLSLNMYAMVLGRTTQSRKTTSLRYMNRLFKAVSVEEEGADYLIPPNSTPESLIKTVAGKPGQSGVFVKDEVQDFFEAAGARGSYTSQFVPLLTLGYDSYFPATARIGREDTKTTLYGMSFYGTGILGQTASALSEKYLLSGFIPRCLIVCDDRKDYNLGAYDVAVKKGSAKKSDKKGEELLVRYLLDAIEYWSARHDEVAEFSVAGRDCRVELDVEDEAMWRWHRFMYDVMYLASVHPSFPDHLMPVSERLGYTVMKVACLLAMIQLQDTVTLDHMLRAIALANDWVKYAEQFVLQVCNSSVSRDAVELQAWLASQKNEGASLQAITLRFLNRWENMKRLNEALAYSQQSGMIRSVIRGKSASERFYFVNTRRDDGNPSSDGEPTTT